MGGGDGRIGFAPSPARGARHQIPLFPFVPTHGRFPSFIAVSSGLMPSMRVSAASPTAVLAVAAGGMGLLVMLGWTVRIPRLLNLGLGARPMLFQARGRRWAALCLEPLAFILLLIALVGVISNWLSIEDLYRWRESPRMSLPTSVGLTLMSASVWLGLRQDSRVQQLYATRE